MRPDQRQGGTHIASLLITPLRILLEAAQNDCRREEGIRSGSGAGAS